MNDSSTPPLTPAAPPATQSGRPVAITVICVLGIIGAVVSIPIIFTDGARQIGAWYPPFLAFGAVIGGICMFGLWKMRRWAVFTYAALVAINQIVLFIAGHWSVFAILVPGIVVAISFAYWARMK